VTIKQLLHIIFFCCFFSAEALPTYTQETTEKQSDSLYLDDSQVYSRSFDDLKEKYNDSEFVYERSKQSSGWWSRFKQWLSDFFKDLFNIQDAGQSSRIVDYMIKIGAALIILLVIYFIYKAVINDEGQWIFGKSSDKNIIPVTDIESNIHQTDFKALIAEAESKNNYRLAIRYYYLWLLKQLTVEEIIEYDVEKTNSDYQYEIKSKDISEKFAYTSYLYNYIWYGEFSVDQNQFSKAKNAFTNFLNQVKA